MRGLARQQTKAKWEKAMDSGQYRGKSGMYRYTNALQERICRGLLKVDAAPINLDQFTLEEKDGVIFADGVPLPSRVSLLPTFLEQLAATRRDRQFLRTVREKLETIRSMFTRPADTPSAEQAENLGERREHETQISRH